MDRSTARILYQATSAFYARESTSFSQTRQRPWKGWDTLFDLIEKDAQPALHAVMRQRTLSDVPTKQTPRVLDMACGNMRFARFLEDRWSSIPFTYYGVDNCRSLVQEGPIHHRYHFCELDICATLLSKHSLADVLDIEPCMLSVCFGFMHHIASLDERKNMLKALAHHTADQGYIALSFWQFANDERMLRKAEAATASGCAELGISLPDANDYLLGWKEDTHVFRYCHHFTDKEIDELVASVAQQTIEIARFSADGKTGNLNRYVVLKKSTHA